VQEAKQIIIYDQQTYIPLTSTHFQCWKRNRDNILNAILMVVKSEMYSFGSQLKLQSRGKSTVSNHFLHLMEAYALCHLVPLSQAVMLPGEV
jgi:hypothetical protein